MKISRVQWVNELPAGWTYAVFGGGRQGRALCGALQRYRPDLSVVAMIDEYVSLPDHRPPILACTPDVLAGTDGVIVPDNLSMAAVEILGTLGVSQLFVLRRGLDFAHLFFEDEIVRYQSQIERCTQWLCSQDRKRYNRVIASRTLDAEFFSSHHPRFSLTPCPSKNGEYVDFYDRQQIRVAVMGGVADAYAEWRVLKALPRLEQMIGYDPFPELYCQSACAIKEDPRFKFVPKGLGATDGEQWLHQCGHGSFLSDKKLAPTDRFIFVTSLDSREMNELDLLKLDVEGSEFSALSGAQETISRCRPVLVVCVYHERDDIFTLPLYLIETLTDYSFHFGHYSNGYLDSVWYAIPNEKRKCR